MSYSFHPDAKRELFEAIKYYEEYKEGLGLDFAKEVYSTIQRIIRFPYGVIYQRADDEIIIIAVMQLNKEPDYWKKRLK